MLGRVGSRHRVKTNTEFLTPYAQESVGSTRHMRDTPARAAYEHGFERGGPSSGRLAPAGGATPMNVRF